MRTIVLTLLLGVALFVPVAAKEDDRLATIHLPEGFVIEPFAKVPNARQMAWGEKGTLFVGTSSPSARASPALIAETDLVVELLQTSRPMLRAAARHHRDQARYAVVQEAIR